MNLSNKVCIITGAASGIGAACARAFAAQIITNGDEATQRDAQLILRGEHPDVREVRRTGPAIDRDQAKDIVHLASLAPVGRMALTNYLMQSVNFALVKRTFPCL